MEITDNCHVYAIINIYPRDKDSGILCHLKRCKEEGCPYPYYYYRVDRVVDGSRSIKWQHHAYTFSNEHHKHCHESEKGRFYVSQSVLRPSIREDMLEYYVNEFERVDPCFASIFIVENDEVAKLIYQTN